LQRNFAQTFAQLGISRKFAHFQFFLNTHLGYSNFADLNLLGQGIFKSVYFFCNLRNFLHNFCFLTKFRNKYLDFCKFVIFLQITEVEPKGFTKTYLMIDLYHNKKIEGGFNFTPPPLQGTRHETRRQGK